MTPIPALAASAIVVYEPIDGGVDHEEEVALANVPVVRTCIQDKVMYSSRLLNMYVDRRLSHG